MFQKILNPDNALMITMTQVTDCIFLSLFWFITGIPLLTLGAASAALYDAAWHGFRKGDKHPWSRYFRSFRRNLKTGILPSMAYLVLFCAGGWGLIQVWNAAAWEQVSIAVFSAAALVVLLALGILSVIFPMLSRFENSFAGLMKNAVLLGLVNLPRTLALGLLNAVSMFLCVRFIVPLFFLPGLAAVLSTWLLEPMFKPYMPEEGISEDAA